MKRTVLVIVMLVVVSFVLGLWLRPALAKAVIPPSSAPAVGAFTANRDLTVRPVDCLDPGPGTSQCPSVGQVKAGQTVTIYGVLISVNNVTWGAVRPQYDQYAPLWVNGNCPLVEFGAYQAADGR